MIKKFYPEVGTKLYLSQRTGDYYVDMVKIPYTVIGVASGKLLVQECQLVFNGPRYYDTLPDEIKEDPNGKVLALSWAPKKGCWQIDKHKTGYPSIAFFNEWWYFPYLN